MGLDARNIAGRGNDSTEPVTTAVYTLQIVMNEEQPSMSDAQAREVFAAEFQRALDNGHFVHQRYDALDFEVVSRIAVHTEDGESLT